MREEQHVAREHMSSRMYPTMAGECWCDGVDVAYSHGLLESGGASAQYSRGSGGTAHEYETCSGRDFVLEFQRRVLAA
jgi:hypothetical protein